MEVMKSNEHENDCVDLLDPDGVTLCFLNPVNGGDEMSKDRIRTGMFTLATPGFDPGGNPLPEREVWVPENEPRRRDIFSTSVSDVTRYRVLSQYWNIHRIGVLGKKVSHSTNLATHCYILRCGMVDHTGPEAYIRLLRSAGSSKPFGFARGKNSSKYRKWAREILRQVLPEQLSGTTDVHLRELLQAPNAGEVIGDFLEERGDEKKALMVRTAWAQHQYCWGSWRRLRFTEIYSRLDNQRMAAQRILGHYGTEEDYQALQVRDDTRRWDLVDPELYTRTYDRIRPDYPRVAYDMDPGIVLRHIDQVYEKCREGRLFEIRHEEDCDELCDLPADGYVMELASGCYPGARISGYTSNRVFVQTLT